MKRNAARILGCTVDQVDELQAVAAAVELVESRCASQVITLNAEMIYQAQTEARLMELINRVDLVVPDGIGTVWAGRRLGYNFPERVTGIDMLMKLCAEACTRGWRVFLLGAAPGVAERAGQKLQQMYPGLQIAGCRDGYFSAEEEPALLQQIRALSPDLLFAALGIPKQEYWIAAHQQELSVPLCMGVGGSFDVISGDKKRAPAWTIRLHLEWLYRLLKEPSRWQRQLVLPRFVMAVIRHGRG